MKLKSIIGILLIFGMGSIALAAGKAKIKAKTVQVSNAAKNKAKKAIKTLKNAGIGITAPEGTAKMDTRLKLVFGESKITEALVDLSIAVRENSGTILAKRGLQGRVNKSMSKISENLTTAESKIAASEHATGTGLSNVALELVQLNQALIKMTAEAIKTGEEASFDKIDKVQSILSDVKLESKSAVEAAKKAIEKILKTDLKSAIDCL